MVNYRLHDWCISAAMGSAHSDHYCDRRDPAGAEKDLPVIADIEDFRPTIQVTLAAREWVVAVEVWSEMRGERRRVRHVPRQRVVLLRYPSADRDEVPFDPAITKTWLPVNSYIGGNEHAVLHLMYSRFITMVLHDMGFLHFEEPFTRFCAHGHITRNGAKMSKTKGNIVNPDKYYGGVGRGHVPHLPHVPRAVRGGRRLPRSVDLRR